MIYHDYEDVVESVAQAWASMDGKLEQFKQCMEDPKLDMIVGHYMGYMEEAGELLRRSGVDNLIKKALYSDG